MYYQIKYVRGYQRWVKANNLEEAKQKFWNEHEDVIEESESIETEEYSSPVEDNSTVEEAYS